MRIAIIAGVCVNYDAISNAVRDEIGWLRAAGHEVRLFAYKCDHLELPFTPVEKVADVAFDCFFQSCDVALFHFGVFYPLFDLLPLVPHHASRVVVFHNITPKVFLPASSHEVIDRSFAQMTNVAFADLVICDSETNRQVLSDAGLDVRATVLPLALSSALRAPVRKPSFDDGVMRVTFVGRLVKSKGPVELVDALSRLLAADSEIRLRADLIGNLTFSDEATIADVTARMHAMRQQHEGRSEIRLHGNATAETKARVLSDADLFVLPTYHEGFCVPILEAFAAGCRTITYSNSNTPSVSAGLATLLPTGDIDALTRAVADAAQAIQCPEWKSRKYGDYVAAARKHVSAFSPDVISRRFVSLIERVVDGTPRRSLAHSLVRHSPIPGADNTATDITF